MFEFKYEGVEMEEQNKMIELKDAELVKKWMIEFLEERLEDVEGFSMGFQRITEEHSDLSMADYKEFLDLIMEHVPAELLTEYKKFYAELLSKRKRKIVQHDLQKELIEIQEDTILKINETFKSLSEEDYSPAAYLKIKKAKLEAENRIKALMISSAYKAESQEIYKKFLTKSKIRNKKQKRNFIFILVSSIGIAVVSLITILCVGAIPKIEYMTVAEYNGKNLEHKISFDNEEDLVVTGVKGWFMPFHYSMDEIQIESHYNDKPVAYIGRNAFRGTTITSVTFPDGIKQIEEGAFRDCLSLEHIYTVREEEVLTDTFPSSLICIQDYAFKNCALLERLTFAEEIQIIGANSFEGCHKELTLYYEGPYSRLPYSFQSSLFKVECKIYQIRITTDNDRLVTVEYGSLFELGVPENRPGYRFDGYYYVSRKITNSLGKALENYWFHQDIFVHAVYSPIMYNITYGESKLMTANYDSYYIIPIPELDIEKGFFTGWYTIVDGKEEMLTDKNGKSITQYQFLDNIEAYPKYKKNFPVILLEYDDEVIVSFDSQGGAPVPDQVLSLANPTLTYPTTTKEGHLFAGWYKDKECTIQFIFHAEIIENCTLYAKWVTSLYPEQVLYTNQASGTLTGQSTYYFSYVPLVSQRITIDIGLDDGSTVYLYDEDFQELSFGFGNLQYFVESNKIYYVYVLTNKDSSFNLQVTGFAEIPIVSENNFIGKVFNLEYGKTATLPYKEIDGYRFIGWYRSFTQITDEFGNLLEPWTYTYANLPHLSAKYEKVSNN